MPYDPDKHHRRSIRLRGYDYAACGAYFVTMCVHRRECLLGAVVDGEVRLNEYGCAVEECWGAIPQHFAHVELDAFVVMPNHVHGIVVITAQSAVDSPVVSDRKRPNGPPRGALGAIVSTFKAASGRRINQLRDTTGMQVWQRDYYEHIIRYAVALDRIRIYIEANPARWAGDMLYPSRA
jgi:REP element-mobilizing transposase RayT